MRWWTVLGVALVALGIESAEVGHAGFTTWTTQGPEGGSIEVLAVARNDPDTILASGETVSKSGSSEVLFRSTDGAQSWSEVSLGSFLFPQIQAILIDPENSQTIYLDTLNYGALKTTDGGLSWAAVNPAPLVARRLAIDPKHPAVLYALVAGAGVFKTTDGGANWGPTGPGTASAGIWRIAVDERETETVYAGTSRGTVLKSVNGGLTWDEVGMGLPLQYEIDSAVTDPQVSGVLYFAGFGGVFKSVDGGLSWQRRSAGLIGAATFDVTIDPITTTTLYVGSGYGVFKSIDGGTTWGPINEGLRDASVRTLEIPQNAPDTIYAGNTDHGHGVFKSLNGGASWNEAHHGIVNTSIEVLATDPSAPGVVYAGAVTGGVYRSDNGGSSWRAVNDGLSVYAVSAVTVDSRAPWTLYAASDSFYEGGIAKSTNGGASWERLVHNIRVRTLAVAPDMLRAVYAGTSDEGILKSTDGGSSWDAVNNGIPSVSIDALAINHQNPALVYAGVRGDGVFKSTNGGDAWSATGLANTIVNALAIHPTIADTVYAATSEGVFKSTNAGIDWTDSFERGLPTLDILALAIDPAEPETVYAGTSGVGVYVTRNGGQSWEAYNPGLPIDYARGTIRALAVDAARSGAVYAGTGRGVYGIGQALVTTPTPSVTLTPPRTISPSPIRTPSATATATPTIEASPDAVEEDVGPGGCCTTDTHASGPTGLDPVETTVCLPNGGRCSIAEARASLAPPSGYAIVGQAITIGAPPGTGNQPLVIVFTIDASQLPAGQTWASVQILRNGDVVRSCVGRYGQASPDPCVTRRRLTSDGDVELTVLTSEASVWNPVVSALDGLLCYGTKATKGASGFTPALGLRLVDGVSTLRSGALFTEAATTFNLAKPGVFCVPVGVDGGGVGRPAVGFQEYLLKLPKMCSDDGRRCAKATECNVGAKCVKQTARVCADDGTPCAKTDQCRAPARCVAHKNFVASADVVVTTALGPLVVHLGKPSATLIPTARTAVGSLPANPPVDRYKCYDLKVAKAVCIGDPARACVDDAGCGDDGPCFQGFAAGWMVRLEGALTPAPKAFVVRKPTALCVPASADGGALTVPAATLQCFAVKAAAGGSKHAPTALDLGNDLGPLVRTTTKETELCLPAEAIVKAPGPSQAVSW